MIISFCLSVRWDNTVVSVNVGLRNEMALIIFNGFRISRTFFRYSVSVIMENTIFSFEMMKGRSKIICSDINSFKNVNFFRKTEFSSYFTLIKQFYVLFFCSRMSIMFNSSGIIKSVIVRPSFIFISIRAIFILYSKSNRNNALPSICSTVSKNPAG